LSIDLLTFEIKQKSWTVLLLNIYSEVEKIKKNYS
jgi:hypothetical protein